MVNFKFASIVLLPLLFLGNLNLHAQTKLNWVKTWGSSHGYANGYSLATDRVGNIFTLGYFADSLYFDEGAQVVSLKAAGELEVFITKRNPEGKLLWAKKFGDSGAIAVVDKIVADHEGSIIISGTFGGTVDFDPGIPKFEMTTVGDIKLSFLLKLNRDGDFVWAKCLGEGSIRAESAGLAVDTLGNIYTTGKTVGRGDFNSSPSPEDTFFIQTKAVDIYLAKLASSGEFIWAKSFSSDMISYSNASSAITIDGNGDILTTGIYFDVMDFDPGPSAFLLKPKNGYSVYVVKLTSKGDFIWAKSFDGELSGRSTDLVTDGAGNVYTTGYLHGRIDFDPGIGTSDTFFIDTYKSGYGGGTRNTFISKLDAQGNFIWAKSIRGYRNSSNEALSIALGRADDVYIGGVFSDTAHFDPATRENFLVAQIGEYGLSADAFIAKYESSGKFKWVKALKSRAGDAVQSIIVDAQEGVLSTGYFTATIQFDPTLPYVAYSGEANAFLMRISQDSCAFSNIDTEVSLTDGTLYARAQGIAYQWLDCQQDYRVIPEATGQAYTPLNSGTYAVLLTENGCKDTSECIAVNTSGLDAKEWSRSIRVYPNPAMDVLYIDAPMNIDVLLTDMVGKTWKRGGSTQLITISDLTGGMYILHIFDKQGNLLKVEKIVKIN